MFRFQEGCLLVYFVLFLNAQAWGISIPEFHIPKGIVVTTFEDQELWGKARASKDEVYSDSSREVHIMLLAKPDDENKVTGNDEWLFLLPYSKESKSGFPIRDYKDLPIEGIQARYYFEDGELRIENFDDDEALNEEQRDLIKTIANKNTSFDRVINLASLKDYDLGKINQLTVEQAATLFGAESANIALESLEEKWQRIVAEFVVNTLSEDGVSCEIRFSILVKSGRPVTFQRVCKRQDKIQGMLRHILSSTYRAWSYSDERISSLSFRLKPSALPAGKVIGLEFIESLGQMAILTKDHSSSYANLSFWDYNQRKVVSSQSYPGDMLLKSDGEQHLFIVSKDRMIQSLMKTETGYVAFSNVVDTPSDFDTSKYIKSISLIGPYPISLNDNNEIEIWNIGYRKINSFPLTQSNPEVIATAEDGRLLTGRSDGSFYIHTLSIGICDENFKEAFCNNPSVEFIESREKIEIDPSNFDLDGKKLGWAELHQHKPIFIYCTDESPRNCGAINYGTKEHWRLSDNNLHFSSGDTLISDSGKFDYSSEEFTQFKPNTWDFYKVGSSYSELYKSLFNSMHDFKNGLPSDQVIIRNSENGSTIDTVSKSTEVLQNLSSPNSSTLMFSTGGAFSSSLYQFDLSSLDLNNLGIVGNSIWSFRVVDNYAFIGMSEASLLVQGDKTLELDKSIYGIHLTEEALTYIQDNDIFRYEPETGDKKLLYSFDSKVFSLQVLDGQGDKMVVQLAGGSFALPHINRVLELPFYGAEGQAIHYDEGSNSFFIPNLQGFSKSYNPAIPTIHQFSVNGDVIGELVPQWGKTAVMNSITGNLWAGDFEGSISVWDIESGILVDKFTAHENRITSIVPVDNKTIATSSSDGSIKIWRANVNSGRSGSREENIAYKTFVEKDIGVRQPNLLATLGVQKDGEYVIFTSDGYYWATPEALHRASFVNDNKLFDYARYDHWLNRPDFVLERLGRPEQRELEQMQKLVSYRQSRFSNHPSKILFDEDPFDFHLLGPKSALADAEIKLSYSADLSSSIDATLHLYVNQNPVYGLKGKLLNDNKGEIELRLTPGINRIKAFLIGSDGEQSGTQYLTYNLFDDSQKSDLYILTIGVSDYQFDGLNLEFARKDAEDVQRLFSKSTLYRNIYQKELLDNEATKSNIISAHNFLKKAQPRDHVVVFFAGHGFLDEHDEYFFGTSDINPHRLEERGISYSDINSLMDGLNSRYKLLLLDTCHSGEVTEFVNGKVLPDGVTSRGLKISISSDQIDEGFPFEILQNTFVDLRSSTGANIISASSGREFALERDDIKNGVFTAGIISALRDKLADIDGNGEISISELRRYVYKYVAELTNGEQRPTTRNYNIETDYRVF